MGFVLLAAVAIAAALGGGVLTRRSVLGKRMERTLEALKPRHEAPIYSAPVSFRDRTREVGQVPASAVPVRKAS